MHITFFFCNLDQIIWIFPGSNLQKAPKYASLNIPDASQTKYSLLTSETDHVLWHGLCSWPQRNSHENELQQSRAVGSSFFGNTTRCWFLLSSDNTWFCAWDSSVKAGISSVHRLATISILSFAHVNLMFCYYSILRLLKLVFLNAVFSLAFCHRCRAHFAFCVVFDSGKYSIICKFVYICLCQLTFSDTFEKVQ